MLVKLSHAFAKQLPKESDVIDKCSVSFWMHVLFTEYLPSQRGSFLPKLTGMAKEVLEGTQKKDAGSRQSVMSACILILTIVVLSISKHQQVSQDSVHKVNALIETQA